MASEYDNELRGFIESGAADSINPYDSLSYLTNHRSTTLQRDYPLSDTSKIHPVRRCALDWPEGRDAKPVEGRILRLCAFETRSKSPFDALCVSIP